MFATLVLGLCLLCQESLSQSNSSQETYTEPSRFPSFESLSGQTDGIDLEFASPVRNRTWNSTNAFPPNGTINIQQRPLYNGMPVLIPLGPENWAQNNSKPYEPQVQFEIGGQPVVLLGSGGQGLLGAERLIGDSPRLLWHVGVYNKEFSPYMQICGGTLVTTKAVISAAHCFWADGFGALPASQFAVGAGKLYRPWNDTHDTLNQKSDVSAVHIPPRYRGTATQFQDDIAVVTLTSELVINAVVRPACVDFDDDFDRQQLTRRNLGTIMGWGLTEENGVPSQVLNFLELPSVDIEECIANGEPSFLKYITSDKICAGVTTGKALCRGDSGGGLIFFDHLSGDRIPYLRGVASTAPRNENQCNAYAIAALTHVSAHRNFLRRHIAGLERECETHYPQARGVDDRSGTEGAVGEGQTCEPVKFVCNCYCNGTNET